MISDSDVEHLADIASGPSGCPRNRETPDSKYPKSQCRDDRRPVVREHLRVPGMGRLVHTGLGSSSLVAMSSTIPLPQREQLCNRYCSNKHTLRRVYHRVAKGTSAMISDSDVEHLADIASGPSGCPRNRETPDSKYPKSQCRDDRRPVVREHLRVPGMGRLVHTGLGSSSLVDMSSTIPLPQREQLCNRYCSNKHTLRRVYHQSIHSSVYPFIICLSPSL
jgi:hypothetical protein